MAALSEKGRWWDKCGGAEWCKDREKLSGWCERFDYGREGDSDYSMVMGSPGKVVRTLDAEQGAAIRMGAKHYVQNAKRFRDQLVIQETADPIK